MAMPPDVLKVTMRGTIATDQWQTSHYFLPDTFGQTGPIPTTFGTNVADAARALWVNFMGYTSAMVTFTGVRLDLYGASGVHVASGDYTPTSGSVTGSASGNHPPQTCVVASLRTATPGAKARGRMYLPLLSGTVNTSTGAFPSADATSIAGYLKSYIAAVAALTTFPGNHWTPVVVSQTGTPATHNLNAIKVGNVFDTQRRRRNKVIETYSTVAYP